MISAGSTLTLVYDGEIPDTEGTYLNTASASIGSTVLGSTNTSVSVAGSAVFNADKSVSIYDPSSLGLYSIPGNDVVYTFTVTNTGSGEADAGTVFLEDQVPVNLTFYYGDFDPANVGMGPIDVNLGTSGVTCCSNSGEIEYSSSASAPAVYGYSPSAGYDPNIKFIRFKPTNAFQGNSTLTLKFRAKIN